MFRFTIRDALWLTVVAALGLGWALERKNVARFDVDNATLWRSHEMMRQAIEVMEDREDSAAALLPKLEPIYANERSAILNEP